MEAAVIVAGMEDMGAVDQHDLARLTHDHADGKRGRFRAGEGFRKDLRGGKLAEDASVSVVVHLHDLHGARQNDADKLRGRALGENRVLLIEKFHPRAQANEHTEQVFLLDFRKKRTFF